MTINIKGKIIVFPDRSNVKVKKRQYEDQIISVQFDYDLVRYYQYFVEKKYGIKLMSVHGCHLSITNGRYPLALDDVDVKSYLKSINNKPIEIECYPENIYRVWRFICIKVDDFKVNEIRKNLGLLPIKTSHITLGKIKDNDLSSLCINNKLLKRQL